MLDLKYFEHKRSEALRVLDEGDVKLSIGIMMSALNMDADTHLPTAVVMHLLGYPWHSEHDGTALMVRAWLEGLDLKQYVHTAAGVDAEAFIDTLDLSIRSYNCLWRAGVTTIQLLLDLPADHFKKVRNLGRKSQCEVIDRMYAAGYTEWAERTARTLNIKIEHETEDF